MGLRLSDKEIEWIIEHIPPKRLAEIEAELAKEKKEEFVKPNEEKEVKCLEC